VIDFTIPEEIKMTVDGVIQFFKREVTPLEEQHRELLEEGPAACQPDGRLRPAVLDLFRQIRMESARAGYYTLLVPEDLGGVGSGPMTMFFLWEAMLHHTGPSRLPHQVIATWNSGPGPVMRGLHPDVRAEVLPKLLSGEHISCFALSEPDAGSDIWNMKTRAVLKGDEWVINGSKQWISNSPYAQHAVLFTVTDPEQFGVHKGGVTAFLVDTDTPGFSVDGIIRIFGHAAGGEGILSFHDMRVPANRLIGEPHRALDRAFGGVSAGRLFNCARAVGLSRWALERATEYAKQRVAFGNPIAEYQGIQWLLADSAMDIYATRMMGLNCAWRMEQGEQAVKEASMIKAFSTEAGFRVLDRCMQVFGGLGLSNDLKLYAAWQQLRAGRIADGSGEIMRRMIARRLLRGDLAF
jgi:acyl-CoA dehydrogenase